MKKRLINTYCCTGRGALNVESRHETVTSERGCGTYTKGLKKAHNSVNNFYAYTKDPK